MNLVPDTVLMSILDYNRLQDQIKSLETQLEWWTQNSNEQKHTISKYRTELFKSYGKRGEKVPIELVLFYDDYHGYSDLVTSCGYEILVSVSEGDYQGDTWYLLRSLQDVTRYGMLTFGWGSCSVCDALQACDNNEDYEALRESLDGSITWGTISETIKYIKTHDWKADYAYSAEFITKSLEYLAKQGVG
jgi:hypothetical protein